MVDICSGVGEYFGMSMPLARFYQNLKIYIIDVLALPFPPDNVSYKEYYCRASGSSGPNNCTAYIYRLFLKDINNNVIDTGVDFYSITGNPLGLDPCTQNPDPVAQCNSCMGLPSEAKNSSVELTCVVYPASFEDAFNSGVIDSSGTNQGLFIRGVGFVVETGFLIGSDFNLDPEDPFIIEIETFDIACIYEVLENVVTSGFLDVEMVDCLTELNEIICCSKFPAKCKLLFIDDYTVNVPPLGSIRRIFFRLAFYFPEVFKPNLGGLPLESYCYYKSFTFEDVNVIIQDRKTDYQRLITDWVANFNEIQDEKMRLLFNIEGYNMQNQGDQVNPLGLLEGNFTYLDQDRNQITFLFNNSSIQSEDYKE